MFAGNDLVFSRERREAKILHVVKGTGARWCSENNRKLLYFGPLINTSVAVAPTQLMEAIKS